MPPKPQPQKVSLWLTRIQAIGFGILLLLIIEVTCQFLGFGKKNFGNDPFVGFSALEPLFALNPTNNRYETRPERIPYFLKDGFHRQKPKGTFRIFVFGGSTVQGRPYALETAFPRWLQINLELAFPNRKFEIVNCGGISYASYRLIPIIEECLAYQPDLFIVCTGQNEFLEARTYGPIKELAKHLGGSVKVIRDLASYQALDTLYHRISGKDPGYTTWKKPTMKMEVDAFLDYRRGLKVYHHDPEWQDGVIAHFQENFRRIQAITKKAGVSLMVLNPPVNLKDSPPFKSEHRLNISEKEEEAFDDWISQANDNYQADPRKAIQYLTWAIELDPKYALTHYSLGHCYLAVAEFAKAEQSFQNALIEDVCPLRLKPSMRNFVDEFSRKNHIPYLDLQSLLKAFSGEPVIGSEILVDHVHPSIRGHQVIAETIAPIIWERFLKDSPSPDWTSKRDSSYQTQFDSLPDIYYTQASIRLKNLMLWTQGESDGLPIEMHHPIENH